MANEYFGKTSKKGIQILPVILTDVALGTLASLVALALGTGLKSIARNMLFKKVHILLAVHGLAANEPVIIGINGNDAGVSSGYGIGTLASLKDPEVVEAYLTSEELVKTVWHETPSILSNTSATHMHTIDKWVSLGGGKGIPATAGAGPEIHALNPTGDALTTGGLVNGVVTFYGVWLED